MTLLRRQVLGALRSILQPALNLDNSLVFWGCFSEDTEGPQHRGLADGQQAAKRGSSSQAARQLWLDPLFNNPHNTHGTLQRGKL